METHNGERNKLRCRPGDLAIISRCNNPSRLGLLVQIIGPHKTGEFDWDVNLLGGAVKGRAIRSGRVGTFRRAAVFDWNLSPLPDLEHLCQEGHQIRRHANLQTL